MADFTLELAGFQRALEGLDDIIDDVETDQRFLVGSGVEYAIFLEVGTSDMDPKPFFGPSINEVRLQGVDGFIRRNSETSVEALETADQVLAVLALALERRVKEIITRKGLIDTGTLRASVLAIPGADPSALPDAGEFSGFDSDNPAPPTAGRAVAEETVEVDL